MGQNSSPQDTLIFIPDISGFTRFVEETAIEHSKHIIQELLDIVIEQNKAQLMIAEIEGDAVFFYTHDIPSWLSLWDQIQSTFVDFHHHLRKYEVLRICQCGACQSANDLTLKFILHIGETIPIQTLISSKPYGKAVIKAHQMLKNDVPLREYLLMTTEAFDLYGFQFDTDDREFSQYKFDFDNSLEGNLFGYSLQHLHSNIPPVANTSVPQLSKSPCRFDLTVNAPHTLVEHNLLDPYYKSHWNRLVTKVHVNDPTNKLQSEHVCLIKNIPISIKTVTHPNLSDKWVFGEQMRDIMFAREVTMYFIVSPLSENTSLVSFELHWLPKSWLFKVYGIMMQWALCQYFRFALRRFKIEVIQLYQSTSSKSPSL